MGRGGGGEGERERERERVRERKKERGGGWYEFLRDENGTKKKKKTLLHLEQIQPLRVVPDRPLVQRPVDRRERGPVDARRGELVLPALAAGVEVVDREQHFGKGLLRERRPGPGRGVEVPVEHRRGAGLPVVDVEDRGTRVGAAADEPREGLEGGAAEEQVRLGLVVAPPINLPATEQVRPAPVRPHEQNFDAVERPRKGLDAQLLDAGDPPSVARLALGARELVDELEPFDGVFGQALVKGQNHNAPGAATGDLEGQAAHDVS